MVNFLTVLLCNSSLIPKMLLSQVKHLTVKKAFSLALPPFIETYHALGQRYLSLSVENFEVILNVENSPAFFKNTSTVL